MEKDEINGMTPEYVAKKIFKVAQKKRVRPFYTVGNMYKILFFLTRVLPRWFVNRVVGAIYAK